MQRPQKNTKNPRWKNIVDFQYPTCSLHNQAQLRDICTEQNCNAKMVPICQVCIKEQHVNHKTKPLQLAFQDLAWEVDENEQPVESSNQTDQQIIDYKKLGRSFRDLGDYCIKIADNIFQAMDKVISKSTGDTQEKRQVRQLFDELLQQSQAQSLSKNMVEISKLCQIDKQGIIILQDLSNQKEKHQIEKQSAQYIQNLKESLQRANKTLEQIFELSNFEQSIKKREEQQKTQLASSVQVSSRQNFQTDRDQLQNSGVMNQTITQNLKKIEQSVVYSTQKIQNINEVITKMKEHAQNCQETECSYNDQNQILVGKQLQIKDGKKRLFKTKCIQGKELNQKIENVKGQQN